MDSNLVFIYFNSAFCNPRSAIGFIYTPSFFRKQGGNGTQSAQPSALRGGCLGGPGVGEKMMERFLVFVAAERAEYSANSPLITARGTEKIPLSHLLLQ